MVMSPKLRLKLLPLALAILFATQAAWSAPTARQQEFFAGLNRAIENDYLEAEKQCDRGDGDVLRCLGGKIENSGRAVERGLFDFTHSLKHDSKLASRYKGLDITKLTKSASGVVWQSFGKDLLTFLEKGNVKSFGDLERRFPELNRVLREMAKLEGGRLAFSASGYDFKKSGKNYCYRDLHAGFGFYGPDTRQKLAAAIIPRYEHPNATKFDCQVSCSVDQQRFGCYPHGDFELIYGKRTFSDYASECMAETGSCGTEPGSTSGAVAAPGAIALPGLPRELGFAVAEGAYTERTNQFLMTTLFNDYLRLSRLNATNSSEVAAHVKLLEDALNSCGSEEAAAADALNAIAIAEENPSKRRELRETAKERRAKSKEKSARGAEAAQRYFRERLKALARETGLGRDRAVPGARGEPLDVYHGRIAQAAECTQRLVQRYTKLKYMLADNATDAGQYHDASTGRQLADLVVQAVLPSLASELFSMGAATPGIDQELKVDGDKLRPVCGRWSSQFIKNHNKGRGRDVVEVSLDGVPYKVDRDSIGRVCQNMRREFEDLALQLDGIANDYPVLFAADDGNRGAMASEVLGNLSSSARDQRLDQYRRGASAGPAARARAICLASDGSVALNSKGEPIVSSNCSSEKSLDGQPLQADSVTDSSGDAQANSCMSLARQGLPSEAQKTAAKNALAKIARPGMEKLASAIRGMACGDKPPAFYRDVVTESPALLGQYLGCTDYDNAASCKDRQNDGFMACMSHKVTYAESLKKGESEAIERAQSAAIGQMIEGLSMLDIMFFMGAPAAAGKFGLSAWGIASGTGFGVMTGVGFTAISDWAGLLPTEAQKNALIERAGWDAAMVYAGYGSAEAAVQSTKRAKEILDQPDPYLHAIVLGMLLGTYGGAFETEHAVKGIVSQDAQKFFDAVKKDDPAYREALGKEYKTWRDKNALVKGDPEAAFITKKFSIESLALPDFETRLQMLRHWQKSLNRKNTASAIEAEARVAAAFDDIILKKYSVNLSQTPLTRLSLEDRLRFISDPELGGKVGAARYLKLRAMRDKLNVKTVAGQRASANAALKTLPSLDLQAVAKRIEEARRSGADDVYLPELAPHVRWVRASLDGVLEKAIKKKRFGYPDLKLETIEATGERLKKDLDRLVLDPKGVSLSKWNLLSTIFVELASPDVFLEPNSFGRRSARVDTYLNTRDLDGKRWGVSASDLDEILKNETKYVPVPVAGDLSIRELNEWMARGLAPIGVVDNRVRYDGFPYPRSPANLFSHDITHWSFIGSRDTHLMIGPEEFFAEFRKWEASFQDPRLRDDLELLWFFAFHEIPGSSKLGYSPYRLNELLKGDDPAAPRSEYFIKLVFERLKPDDLGVHYSGRDLPKLKELGRAADLLLEFAEKTEGKWTTKLKSRVEPRVEPPFVIEKFKFGDFQSQRKALNEWEESASKDAEERAAAAFDDIILKKYGVTLSDAPLSRLTLEDRLRFISDPELQGKSGAERYAQLRAARAMANVESLAAGHLVTPLEKPKLPPKFDVHVVAKRVEDARRNKSDDVYLPELVPHVQWVLASLDGVFERAAKSTKPRLDREQLILLARVIEKMKHDLGRMLRDPKGVSLSRWTYLSYVFAEIAAPSAMIPVDSKLGATREWNKYLNPTIPKQALSSNGPLWRRKLEGILSDESLLVPVPVAGDLDVREINEWMASGLAPVGVADAPVYYDGSLSPRIPRDFYEHDVVHWQDLQYRDTKLKIDSKQYYAEFQKWKDSFSDPKLKEDLELLWFFVFHETLGDKRLGYSPEFITQVFRRGDNYNSKLYTADNVLRRLEPNDLGSYYHDHRKPTREELQHAINKLLEFADKTASEFTPFTIEKFKIGNFKTRLNGLATWEKTASPEAKAQVAAELDRVIKKQLGVDLSSEPDLRLSNEERFQFLYDPEFDGADGQVRLNIVRRRKRMEALKGR